MGDDGLERVPVRADVALGLELDGRRDDLGVRVGRVVVVEDRPVQRIDVDLRGRAQVAQHDIVVGIDVDIAVGRVDVGAVGHRDAALEVAVEVGGQRYELGAGHGTEIVGIDVTRGTEHNMPVGEQRNVTAEAPDSGIDRDVLIRHQQDERSGRPGVGYDVLVDRHAGHLGVARRGVVTRDLREHAGHG